MRAQVLAVCTAALLVPASFAPSHAQVNLPALGDSVSDDFGIGAEKKIGVQIMREIRRDPDYLDDPLLLDDREPKLEWPEDALDAYLEGDLVGLTRHTVTAPAALRKRLAEVRRAGFAWGLEEFAEGIDSVAAPIRDSRGKAIGAIHIQGPSYRFPPTRREAAVAARLMAACAEVSAQHGGV